MRTSLFLFMVATMSGCSSSSSPASPSDSGVQPKDASGTPDTAIPEFDSASGPSEAGPAEPPDATDASDTVDAAKAPCVTDPGVGDAGLDPATFAQVTPQNFGITQAMAGFPAGDGELQALISTEKGTIRCTLDLAKAPTTVANFVGLARGTRPYKQGTAWKVGKFYDGLKWHRVIPGFVIQGGDPNGTGTGGSGYALPNENHVDEPLGTLAMAASNRPSGSQFYIVVGQGPAADYNVFGSCDTSAAIAISEVPRDADDMPVTEVHMQKVEVVRCPK